MAEIDPKVTFTPESLSQGFQKYRTDLITMPMFSMKPALDVMGVRTGIRYKEHIHEMTGKFELGAYKKRRMGKGDIDIKQRTLETFFGNCIEPIDPNSIYQSLWGSDITKGDGLKNIPWVKRVCAYMMAQLGENLFNNMFTAKRVDDSDTTAELFNGFCTIISDEESKGNLSQKLRNLTYIDAITEENAEDVFKDFYWGNVAAGWRGSHAKLRSRKLNLYMSDRAKHLYEVAYQANHGSLPYNEQFNKAFLEGAPNVSFVALPNVPDDFLMLSPRNNVLCLFNQKSADETFLVEKSLDNHYDLDFIANMFYGEQFESINKEVFLAGVIKNKVYAAPEDDEDDEDEELGVGG